MPRHLTQRSRQFIRELAGVIALEWVSKTLPNIGRPNFSSSSTTPRGLDSILRDVAAEAMQPASTQPLEGIIKYMEANETLAEYPQLFQPFFHHLRSAPPARCTTEADQLKIRIGTVSLRGVYLVHEHLQRILMVFPDDDHSLILCALGDSWPTMWKWIKYLYNLDPEVFSSIIHPLGLDATLFRGLLVRIFSLVVLGASTRFRDVIKRTPGVFALLVDMWEKASKAEMPEHLAQINSSLASVAVHGFLRSNPTHAQVLVKLMNGDINRIATVVMNNLRQAFNGNDKRAAIGRFHRMVILSAVIVELLPGLRHALLSQNSMVMVIRAYGRISSMRAMPYGSERESSPHPHVLSPIQRAAAATLNDHDRSSDVDLVTAVCLDYFSEASMTSGGFTWVIQAIRSGMISTILRSACRGGEVINDRFKGCITDIIQQHLIYRSVLRALSRVFQDPIISTLESKLPRNAEIFKVWVKFRELLELRLAAKEKFDTGRDYAQWCSSPRCDKVEGNNEIFRLCANCQEACYCSPECQKYDWKHEGHREACESLRRDRADGIAPPISTRDLAFFHFVATNDIINHRDEILKIRDERFTSGLAHPHSFVVCINPSSHPSTFSVHADSDDYEIDYHVYNSTRQFNDMASTVISGTPSVNVEINILVPYGDEDIIIPYQSDIASALLGWDSCIGSARLVEYVDINHSES